MVVKTETISLETKGNGQMIDITDKVNSAVGASGLKSGTATIFVPGSTGGITTIEYESGLVHDMEEMFELVAPQAKEYQHNLRWHDGNGHSHVRASLLGPSLTAPFSEGSLILGTWQQIVFIDFDNKSRSREIVVQVMGE